MKNNGNILNSLMFFHIPLPELVDAYDLYIKDSSIGSGEKNELLDMLIDEQVAIDPDKEELTYGEKIADKLTQVAGSWNFIIGFFIFLSLWIILNLTGIIKLDEFPFILLNLLLSCLAAFQAPIIMMSQNRQSKKDTLRSKNDYRIDLKSEFCCKPLPLAQEKPPGPNDFTREYY